MSKRAAIAASLGLAVLAGIYLMSPWATPDPSWPDWLLVALSLLCVFAWLGADQREFGHRRSVWMNLGIVLLSVVFIAVYLVRTRPAGRKLRSLGAYALLLLGWIAAHLAGSALGWLLLPETTAS